MPLNNPRQGRKNAKHVLFFECDSFGCDKRWGTAARGSEGVLFIELVEEVGGKETRLHQHFDVAALRQLIDWAEGRPVGIASEDNP